MKPTQAQIDDGRIELLPDTGKLALKYTDRDLYECEQATIERCAQVVENFEWGKDDDNSTLAAAIRALKEKP